MSDDVERGHDAPLLLAGVLVLLTSAGGAAIYAAPGMLRGLYFAGRSSRVGLARLPRTQRTGPKHVRARFISPACAFLAAWAARRERVALAGLLLLLSSTSMASYVYIANAVAFLAGLLLMAYAASEAVLDRQLTS